MQRNGLKRCPAGGGPDPAQPDRKWEAPSPTIAGAVTAQIGRQPRALRLLARWSTPEHAAARGAAPLPGREGGHDPALDLTREGLVLLHPVVLLRAPPGPVLGPERVREVAQPMQRLVEQRVVRLLDPVVRRGVLSLPPVVEERQRGPGPEGGDPEAVVRVRVRPLILQDLPRDRVREQRVLPEALRRPTGPEDQDRRNEVASAGRLWPKRRCVRPQEAEVPLAGGAADGAREPVWVELRERVVQEMALGERSRLPEQLGHHVAGEAEGLRCEAGASLRGHVLRDGPEPQDDGRWPKPRIRILDPALRVPVRVDRPHRAGGPLLV